MLADKSQKEENICSNSDGNIFPNSDGNICRNFDGNICRNFDGNCCQNFDGNISVYLVGTALSDQGWGGHWGPDFLWDAWSA